MKYTIFGSDGSYESGKVAYESTLDATREVMKKMLARRGLMSKEDITDFLVPNYEKWVKNPLGIAGMSTAVERIVLAMKNGEKICIYSDYDCDGIPGGAVLSDFFDYIGYTNRIHYIPHRHKEGYGINKGAIEKLAQDGVTLMITVDNGITNHAEVLFAKEKRVDIIVTDHHLPLRSEISVKEMNAGKQGTQLIPEAFVVLNSKRDDCEYHDDMLCGCAVAWKLACAVLMVLREEGKVVNVEEGGVSAKPKVSRSKKKVLKDGELSDDYKKILEKVKNTKIGWEKWWLDLVAISTIADMVPLRKENRVLAYFGMKVLQKSTRPGLQKLLALAKTKQEKITAMDIAFTIAPRVNAASRMSDPIVSYHMLKGGDSALSISSAEELERLNTMRKDTVKGIKREVMGYDLDIHTHVVVIGSEQWGPGVLGLIAQEVYDETGKPTFVFGAGEMEGEYKGSCRAPDHVNLVDLMSACTPGTFLGFGGHSAAGGFSVEKTKVGDLASTLNAAYEKLELHHEVPEEETIVDTYLTFNEVTNTLHKELEKLEPCGEGNPRPLFAFKSEGALSVREFGKQGGHFELLYEKEESRMKSVEEESSVREIYSYMRGGKTDTTVKVIYFFGEEDKLFLAKGKHTLIAEMEVSHFGWKPELRLRVVDIVGSM